MAKYEVPATAQERIDALKNFIKDFTNNMEDFTTMQKKAAGSRAKKILNGVRKLITPVRRDIQEQILSMKKKKEVAAE